MDLLATLTIDDFAPHVGSNFRLTLDGTPIDLRLDRVTRLMENHRARPARQPFSLDFSGPPDRFMTQRIYEMRHEAFAEPLHLFIVPVGQTRESYEYEAVFT